jgi:hypothetical protein
MPVDQRPYEFDAFISYSREDASFVAVLQSTLESRYRRLLPKEVRGERARLALCRDETDLTSTGNLLPTLLDKVRTSRKLLVVCSPSARSSQWVAREIAAYRETHGTRGNDGIVAILHRGDDPVTECAIPPALLEEGEEPAAVEFRREKLRGVTFDEYLRGDGALRILAPVLGHDYPHLRGRHQAYERERLRRLVGIAAGLALLFAVLSLFAWLQYVRANHERALALSNLNDALLGYAGLARQEVSVRDLVSAETDFAYLLELARATPPEDAPGLALLWGTFADGLVELGEAYRSAGDSSGSARAFGNARVILHELLRIADATAGDPRWQSVLTKPVTSIGKPGQIFISAPDSATPTKVTQWRTLLEHVNRSTPARAPEPLLYDPPASPPRPELVTLPDGLTYVVLTRQGTPVPFRSAMVDLTALGPLLDTSTGQTEWFLSATVRMAGRVRVTVTTPIGDGRPSSHLFEGPGELRMRFQGNAGNRATWRWLEEPGVTWIPFVLTFEDERSRRRLRAVQWTRFDSAAKARLRAGLREGRV